MPIVMLNGYVAVRPFDLGASITTNSATGMTRAVNTTELIQVDVVFGDGDRVPSGCRAWVRPDVRADVDAKLVRTIDDQKVVLVAVQLIRAVERA